jgi:CheY-like chemotaxis protein
MMTNTAWHKSILVVHNCDNMQTTLERLFGDAGFTTSATWSGHEALSLIESRKFDAVLMDDYLADIHAAEFLQRVKRMPVKTPVILMQNRPPTRADARRYGSLGVFAVVEKGNVERVREAVAKCCLPHGPATVH